MNIDEFLKQAEEDDLADREWMTPVQYAKIRKIHPQQIYQWIRNGKVEWKFCECGRKVIRMADIDEILRRLGKLAPADLETESDEDSGGELQ